MFGKSGYLLRALFVGSFVASLVACTFEQEGTGEEEKRSTSSEVGDGRRGEADPDSVFDPVDGEGDDDAIDAGPYGHDAGPYGHDAGPYGHDAGAYDGGPYGHDAGVYDGGAYGHDAGPFGDAGAYDAGGGW